MNTVGIDAFEFWCQRNAPEVWYGKERDEAKEREFHRLRMCFVDGWRANDAHRLAVCRNDGSVHNLPNPPHAGDSD